MSEPEYELVTSFWIDTDGYTDRDRDMFVCGFEFARILEAIEKGDGWAGPIHTENQSRVRMLCGRMRVPCSMKTEVQAEWTHLKIPKQRKK